MVCDNRALLLHFEALNPNGGGGCCCGDTRIEEKQGHTLAHKLHNAVLVLKSSTFLCRTVSCVELCRVADRNFFITHTHTRVTGLGRSSDICIGD